MNRRVLIVDDNCAIHDDFKKILCEVEADLELGDAEAFLFGESDEEVKVPDFELAFADQGKTARDMVANSVANGKPYALAFVDMRMPPGWDGVKTIQHLWQVDPQLHVVICTAYSDYSSRQVLNSLGESDQLIMVKKPFEPEEVLLAAISMTCKWEQSRQAKAARSELEREVRERTKEVVQTQDMLAFSLARLAESRDQETGDHLERMREYSQLLAECLAFSGPYQEQINARFLEDLYRSSPLHDIGKVGIPDAVLLKPGKLNDREFEIMKTHTRIGAETLRNTMNQGSSGTFLQMAIEIAESHHERFDGEGYPQGLVGKEIPLAARIVALADAYDAITSRRVYKYPTPAEEAKEIILQDSGKHFDPAIVDAFVACFDQFVEVIRHSAADSKASHQDDPAKESSPGITFENPVNPELVDVTT